MPNIEHEFVSHKSEIPAITVGFRPKPNFVGRLLSCFWFVFPLFASKQQSHQMLSLKLSSVAPLSHRSRMHEMSSLFGSGGRRSEIIHFENSKFLRKDRVRTVRFCVIADFNVENFRFRQAARQLPREMACPSTEPHKTYDTLESELKSNIEMHLERWKSNWRGNKSLYLTFGAIVLVSSVLGFVNYRFDVNGIFNCSRFFFYYYSKGMNVRSAYAWRTINERSANAQRTLCRNNFSSIFDFETKNDRHSRLKGRFGCLILMMVSIWLSLSFHLPMHQHTHAHTHYPHDTSWWCGSRQKKRHSTR